MADARPQALGAVPSLLRLELSVRQELGATLARDEVEKEFHTLLCEALQIPVASLRVRKRPAPYVHWVCLMQHRPNPRLSPMPRAHVHRCALPACDAWGSTTSRLTLAAAGSAAMFVPHVCDASWWRSDPLSSTTEKQRREVYATAAAADNENDDESDGHEEGDGAVGVGADVDGANPETPGTPTLEDEFDSYDSYDNADDDEVDNGDDHGDMNHRHEDADLTDPDEDVIEEVDLIDDDDDDDDDGDNAAGHADDAGQAQGETDVPEDGDGALLFSAATSSQFFGGLRFASIDLRREAAVLSNSGAVDLSLTGMRPLPPLPLSLPPFPLFPMVMHPPSLSLSLRPSVSLRFFFSPSHHYVYFSLNLAALSLSQAAFCKTFAGITGRGCSTTASR